MSKDKEKRKTGSHKKRGPLKWMKKHKIATAVISIILICVLIIAGTVGSVLWGLYKDSVDIVGDQCPPCRNGFPRP